MELLTGPTPNGWKVTIMLEELIEAGVDLPEIEVRAISLDEREQFSKEYTAINPNQKIPALVDGSRNIMESCAILMYLGEKFPSPLFPEGELRWQIIPWVFWQAANVGPAFGNKLSYTRYMDNIDPELKAHPLERFGNEAMRLSRVLDAQLEGHDYICGDTFTIADIACYPWLRGWKWSKVDITGDANVMAWIERVRARPGVDRGLKYGMPADEVDQWSEERKAQYRRGGSSIASNASINNDGR